MQELIDAIHAATDALADTAAEKHLTANFRTRDWAAFFAAIAGFLTKLAPLIIPLLVKNDEQTN